MLLDGNNSSTTAVAAAVRGVVNCGSNKLY